MKLDFLNNVTVAAAPVVAKKAAPANRAKQRQPLDDNTIRLFKDGSVYPAQQLIDLLGLEYGKRDDLGDPTGFGFDIIDSRDMTNQLVGLGPNDAFVGIALVARKEGKLDLFASCKYETNGDPTASVATQGSNTYGKEQLIPLLSEVYGMEFQFNEEGYVDLSIVTQHAFKSPDDRFFIYKRISRGVDQGKKTYATRVGIVIHPLVPVLQLGETSPSDTDAEVAHTPSTPRGKKLSTLAKAEDDAASADEFIDALSGNSAMEHEFDPDNE